MKKVINENKKKRKKVNRVILFVSLLDRVADLNNFKTVSYAFNCCDEWLAKHLVKLFS